MAKTELTYQYDSTNQGYIVTGCSSIADDGTVIIPSIYNDGSNGEQPIIKIENEAFMEENITYLNLSKNIKEIGKLAFWGCTYLKRVIFSNSSSLTTIGESSFSHCYELEEISLPNGLKEIGKWAFYNCKNLEALIIPKSVTTIGERIIAGCEKLNVLWTPFVGMQVNSTTMPLGYYFASEEDKSNIETKNYTRTVQNYGDGTSSLVAYFPNSLKEIHITNTINNGQLGYGAFQGCSMIEKVYFKDQSGGELSRINTRCFEKCSALKEISIPETVTILNYGAFNNCTELKTITLPSKLQVINNQSFGFCSNLTSIHIPATVTSIGEEAFQGDVKLENIQVDPNNLYFYSIDGNLYSRNDLKLYQYALGKTDAVFSIPEGTKKLGKVAFYRAYNLNKINIPKSIEEIGELTFNYSNSLEEIEVHKENQHFCSIDGVLYSKDKTTLFAYPKGNERNFIKIPEEVTTIEKWSFRQAQYLVKIELPSRLETIRKGAFSETYALAYIAIPGSVTSIEEKAFEWSGLTSIWLKEGGGAITFGANSETVNSDTGGYKGSSTDSTTQSNNSVFYRCTNLFAVYNDRDNQIRVNDTNVGSIAFYAKYFDGNIWKKIEGNNELELQTVPIVNGRYRVLNDMLFQITPGETSNNFADLNANITNGFNDRIQFSKDKDGNPISILRAYIAPERNLLEAITIPTNEEFSEEYKDDEAVKVKNIYYLTDAKGFINVRIPEEKSLNDYSFNYSRSLIQATILCSQISYHSFNHCENLTTVSLSNTKKIGNGVFSATNLKKIELPATLESIGWNYPSQIGAFYQCFQLKEVKFNSGNVEIVNTPPAFEFCSNIVFTTNDSTKPLEYRKTLENYPYGASNAKFIFSNDFSADTDFLGFTFNGKHSLYDLNVYRVIDGDRYNDYLSPELQDKTAEVPGGDGVYYFGTTHKSKKFSINIAFDSLTEGQLREWKQFCSAKEMGDLIFDEAPYKAYTAKITGSPSMKYVCFTINGERIYKGEGTIEFTCYWPYAHTIDSSTKVSSKLSSWGTFGADGKLLENYPEVVYTTKSEWAPSSGLQGLTTVCLGENPGDLPTPFILSYSSLGDGRKFKVGDAEIEVYGTLQLGETLKWDSKIGLVYAENAQKEKRIFPHKGQGCATIAAGVTSTNVTALSWNSTTTSWEEAEAPTLLYHYWYY